jgi:transposase
MYYIGLDVYKKTISHCVKDAAGKIYQEGKIGSTRCELDAWIKTLPQPRMMAMEATIFAGWIYDYLLPHAEKVKVAHPLMLRAISAAKRKNDTIDARKIADCLRCDLLPECHMASTEIRDRRRTLRYRNLVLRQVVQMKNRVSGLLIPASTTSSRPSATVGCAARGRVRPRERHQDLSMRRRQVPQITAWATEATPEALFG